MSPREVVDPRGHFAPAIWLDRQLFELVKVFVIPVEKRQTNASLFDQNGYHRREFADCKRLIELKPLPSKAKVAYLENLLTLVLRCGLECSSGKGGVAMSVAEQENPHGVEARGGSPSSVLVLIVTEQPREAIHEEVSVGEAEPDGDEKAE
jgi:hypothetical protein